MNSNNNYIETNKKLWNDRTKVHYESNFYDVEGFLKGNSSLNQIELELLGDVSDKSILHLQCHFGLDTLSLNRLGANVTGVDFSEKAIEIAQEISSKTNLKSSFICSSVYDLPNYLNQKFDIIYTSYGTIGWLPDIDKWSSIISKFLKPNGRFVFVEFHPAIWMFDDKFEEITYKYNNSDAIVELENGTYANRDANLEHKSITWNHGIGEVVSSLLENDIALISLKEYDYSPYDCFYGTEEFKKGCFRIKKFGNKLPMVYSIVGEKRR